MLKLEIMTKMKLEIMTKMKYVKLDVLSSPNSHNSQLGFFLFIYSLFLQITSPEEGISNGRNPGERTAATTANERQRCSDDGERTAAMRSSTTAPPPRSRSSSAHGLASTPLALSCTPEGRQRLVTPTVTLHGHTEGEREVGEREIGGERGEERERKERKRRESVLRVVFI